LGDEKRALKSGRKISDFLSIYICSALLFFNFLRKKNFATNEKIYQNLQCDEKRLRKFVFSLQ
jgi:hypothetical protein